MKKSGVTKKGGDFSKHFDNLISRANAARTVLSVNVYKIYQNAQRKRWMTEGASEGKKWKALSPAYIERKKIMYGGGQKHKWIGGRGKGRPWTKAGKWPSYPGKGTKMLIATNRLYESVVGPHADHRKMVTEKRLIVGTRVKYAHDVNKVRPFNHWSKDTLDKMRLAVSKHMKGK